MGVLTKKYSFDPNYNLMSAGDDSLSYFKSCQFPLRAVPARHHGSCIYHIGLDMRRWPFFCFWQFSCLSPGFFPMIMTAARRSGF